MRGTASQIDGKSIRSILSERMPYLRPSEQNVASFLLYEAAEKTDWKLDELAKSAGAAPSAIVRMCQAIGFDGFRDFRVRWATEQSALRHSERPDLHVLGPAVDSLIETARLLSPDDVDRAARAICSARSVFVHGRGGSGHMARIAASSLTILGRMAFHLEETERDAANLPADKETVVIVISHRGEHPALKQFAERCQARGAQTVVITSGASTELAKTADIVLLTGAPVPNDRRRLEEAPARVVQMAVIQALVYHVAEYMVRSESPEAERSK